MQRFNVGDRVAVLNEPIYGVIIETGTKKSKVEDDDGFVREYRNEQLVLSQKEDHYQLHAIHTKAEMKQPVKVSKPAVSTVKKITSNNPAEIDLHIDALDQNFISTDINQALQKQMVACRAFVKKHIEKRSKKIILIHGKGEGVLKAEIYHYLTRLSAETGLDIDFRDASSLEYGKGGATEVIFKWS